MSELFDDFKSIVLNKTPLLDVRAPVEFKNGSFLNACNLPIMNDEERRLVGICYKNEGNAKAIELGHKLVSGVVKEQRVQAWIEFIKSNPSALLYCFRGGQRSKITQTWLKENGVEIPRLKGGYKAFRNFLLSEIEISFKYIQPVILGGKTGSGKTIFLKRFQNSIDLEALANHRGSAFGQKITPQTTQIDFENALAYELIQKREAGFETLLFEDEGKHVGSVFMPESFIAATADAGLVILEASLESRIETTLDEYVVQAQKNYEAAGFEEPFMAWQQSIKDAMKKIERRLGYEKYAIVTSLFESAVGEQLQNGSFLGYKDWVEYLLLYYYDPMYDYQIQKRSHRVLFCSDALEVEAFMKERALCFL